MKKFLFILSVLILVGCSEDNTTVVKSVQTCDVVQEPDKSVTISCGDQVLQVPPNVVTVTEVQIVEVPVIIYVKCHKHNHKKCKHHHE